MTGFVCPLLSQHRHLPVTVKMTVKLNDQDQEYSIHAGFMVLEIIEWE